MNFSKNAIAYCVTGTHIQLSAVSIASLVRNYASEESLDILLIANDVLSQDLSLIQNIPTFYGKEQIRIYIEKPPKITEQIIDYTHDRFPEVTLWRLFLPYSFPNYTKIVYLDNDTLLYDDVSYFFDLLHEPNIIAAVRDFYFQVAEDTDRYPEEFGISTMKNYFNSGVLIIDTQLFNNKITTDTLLEMIAEKKYPCLDQTILNILCEGYVEYLPFSYNYQKEDRWLYKWAVDYNPTAAEILRCRDFISVRHFIEFEALSMPWEHFSAFNKWEYDFWNYMIEVKKMNNLFGSSAIPEIQHDVKSPILEGQ